MKLRAVVVPTLLALGAVVLSCRDATQIRVRVVTNLGCPGAGAPELVDTSVLAGQIGKVSGPVQAQTLSCTAGAPSDIGDVYVFPREDKDGSAEVWVVAGQTLKTGDKKDAEACVNAYADFVTRQTPFPAECIIAKRRLEFVPHEGLELTVLINAACGGIACDPDETCYDERGCVDNRVRCDDDGNCILEEEGVGGAGGGDATATAASASDASASNARVSSASDGSSGTESTATDMVSSQSGSGSMTDTSTGSGAMGCETISCDNPGSCDQCCAQSPPGGLMGICGGGNMCACVPFMSSSSGGPSSSSSSGGPTSSSGGPSSSSSSGGGPTSSSGGPSSSSSSGGGPTSSSGGPSSSSSGGGPSSSSTSGPSSSSGGSNCVPGTYFGIDCVDCDMVCMSHGCFGLVGCIDSGGGIGGNGGAGGSGGGVSCTCTD